MANQNINDMSVTWNDGATTFDAIKMNVTDTASAAGSRLFNLAVGSSIYYEATASRSLNIYNTYTDASNYERLAIKWDTNVATIITEGAGTGTQRNLLVDSDETTIRGGSSAKVVAAGNFLNLYGGGAGNRIEFINDGFYAKANAFPLGKSDASAGFNALIMVDRNSDPTVDENGNFAIWQSDGTGSGDDGDIMIAIQDSSGTKKTITLVDFSAA